MTQPIWLAPGVTVDDVAAGLVTAATWWNMREAIPARVVHVNARDRTWLIRSETETTGSGRSFIWEPNEETPMCGRFSLYVGEHMAARRNYDDPIPPTLAALRHIAREAWGRFDAASPAQRRAPSLPP